MPSFNQLITVEDSHGEYDAHADVEFSRDGECIILEHVTYTDKAGNTVDYTANDYDETFIETAQDLERY